MLAGRRNARPRAGRRRKPVGAAGTRAMPLPGGLTNARRKPSPRRDHCGCPRRSLMASLAESGPADTDRGGGGRKPARPLPGHRRLQAHRGVRRLVGFHQRGARYATPEPLVVELAAHRPQASFDVAHALAVSQLSEGQTAGSQFRRKTVQIEKSSPKA